uniref:Protein binding protein n=1 Tax=Rhizophora mucronata TaxID=61149 RepID=A0A2P2NPM5_RHIMU
MQTLEIRENHSHLRRSLRRCFRVPSIPLLLKVRRGGVGEV